MRGRRLEPTRRSFLVGAAATVSLLSLPSCLTGTNPASRPANQSQPQPGNNRVLWGMFIDEAVKATRGFDSASVQRLQQLLNHRIDIYHWYNQWSDPWGHVSGRVGQIISSGRIPFITWEAFNAPLDSIVGGVRDGYIDSWARGLAGQQPAVVWIRLFHEFNDNTEYPWQTTKNAPATFVAAWRHVHDRFTRVGATNVRWLWNFDGTSSPTVDSLRAGYPGDAYVDFVGWDGPDDGTNYALTRQVAPNKPIVIAEVSDGDGQENRQLQQMGQLINAERLPDIQAVVYFDADQATVRSGQQNAGTIKSMLSGPSFR